MRSSEKREAPRPSCAPRSLHRSNRPGRPNAGGIKPVFWNGHYGRPEIMAWCEAHSIDYVFGLPGNKVLHTDPAIVTQGDACATDRALGLTSGGLGVLCRYAETRYAAGSWATAKRCVAARIEASSLGVDIRFVVTPIKDGSAEPIYDTLCCARGQAENLIKLHIAHLKSDRTSCRSANATPMGRPDRPQRSPLILVKSPEPRIGDKAGLGDRKVAPSHDRQRCRDRLSSR